MRKWLAWTLQLVLACVVVAMAWAALSRNWGQFRSLRVALDLKPGWIALALLPIALSYASSIEVWRRLLAGWGQHLAYVQAARVWLVSNLGRYIPGAIWSVAGFVVLAQRAGVATWAAGASILAIQAVAVGTGVVLVLAFTPAAESPVRLGAAALAAVATIGVLAWGRATRLVAGVLKSANPISPLPVRTVAQSSALGLLSWLLHGTAFWLLARGLGLPGTLSLATAIGAFALGNVLGILAIFAPGGVGVREVVLISVLTPELGAGGAVALSVTSRILLTFAEVAAPAGVLLATRHRKENVSVRA